MSRNFLMGIVGLAFMALLAVGVTLAFRSLKEPVQFAQQTHMPVLRETKEPLLVRTDFSSDAKWATLVSTLEQPTSLGLVRTQAKLELLNDPTHAGASIDKICSTAADYAQKHGYLFIADAATFQQPEPTLVVVDLREEPGRSFRAPLDQIAIIENNFALGDSQFTRFFQQAGPDGVYRGSPH